MFEFNEKLLYSLGVYIAACYFLYQMKHPKMFDDKGDFKAFGLQSGETVFPFWLVTLVIGLGSYTYFVTRGVNFV
jgi:hypothetical protein